MPQVRVVDDKYRRASLCQRHHFAAGESAQVDGIRHTTSARHFRRHERLGKWDERRQYRASVVWCRDMRRPLLETSASFGSSLSAMRSGLSSFRF